MRITENIGSFVGSSIFLHMIPAKLWSHFVELHRQHVDLYTNKMNYRTWLDLSVFIVVDGICYTLSRKECLRFNLYIYLASWLILSTRHNIRKWYQMMIVYAMCDEQCVLQLLYNISNPYQTISIFCTFVMRSKNYLQ